MKYVAKIFAALVLAGFTTGASAVWAYDPDDPTGGGEFGVSPDSATPSSFYEEHFNTETFESQF
ncbi:MAG: hypothetical protein HY900_03855 [Deltaproteobacteria bacterium]|nr:hypothetical protein [Deltaproteobacteria bacterium]